MEEKYEGISIEGRFKEPPNEFRMMPFWFWNHEMVEKEVTRQIQDHYDHGIGGEFIHPRHGRLTPYLGKRWMENVEASADKCKELDMWCFLYDEDNWPSGPVSGLITGPYRPENRGKWLGVFDEDVFEGPEKIEYDLDYKQISPESMFYAAIALPNTEDYPNFSESISKLIDVTEFVKDDKLVWEVPDGEWTIIFFCVMLNSPFSTLNGYIDILRKETCREFINETHKKYVDYFIEVGKKDYLGDVVPGIFTDEPSMSHIGVPSGMMMKLISFTPTLPQKFKEMWGYEFNKTLISLFYETGDISAKHRCEYWECLTQMYVDAFYKQIYEYCDEYGLRSTGHINAEGVFPQHVYNQGDFFKVFEYMHYGGCDQLTEDVRPDGIEDLWNYQGAPYTGFCNEMMLASKLASSAAHLLGKPRVLVEAFGTSSWDITLASAKRVNDYLILTGCDLFVPHDFAYSEDGYRKQDHPASFCHQPYYKHWKKLMDHNARLCSVFNAHSGVLNAEVLYLYPVKSFYAESMPRETMMTQFLGSVLPHNIDCMLRQQLDFEIASEEIIDKCTIEGNTIKIKDQSFKVLNLGAVSCISKSFALKAKEFFENGGKIFATLELPFKESHSGVSNEVIEIMNSIFKVDSMKIHDDRVNDRIDKYSIVENIHPNGGRAIFIKGPNRNPWTGEYYPLVEDAFKKLILAKEKDVTAWYDDKHKKYASYVMCCHKTIEKKEYYFIANTSRTASYPKCELNLKVLPKQVELWDTISGDIKAIDYYGIEKKKLILTLDLSPYKSYVVVVTPESNSENIPSKKISENPVSKKGKLIKTIDLGESWKCKLNDVNAVMLNEKWMSSYHIEAGNAWGYKSERTFTHQFHVSDLSDIGQIRLVIEGLTGDYGWGKTTYMTLSGGDRATVNLNNVSVLVNGNKVNINFKFDFDYLDAGWIVSDITKYLKEGINEVSMVCRTGNHAIFHVVTDPWRLIGKFASELKDGIPYIKRANDTIKLGDLTQQGFSRYHGGFSYIQEILIADTYKDKKFELIINKTTDCIEVIVNGKLCEVLWNKWNADITDAIKIGEKNTIELVHYGIAQNMLQTNIKSQGIEGKVSLNIFQ